ncbi:fibrinogen-like protein 1 [Drosophila obscura]|uniref:fibrinogen-like protein 1 n=1 Tax=Drosophila obscura TaxID=7282 RepID=UPI001BB243F3|nr:fibrinogen-like protein 1 [Drosophila obscura]
MKFSTFLVIILWMFLQGKSSLASEYKMEQEVTILEQCHGYCFSVLQPFLDHLLQFKEANYEMNLQSQLLKSMTEIKNNVEQMKVMAEPTKDLREQIKGKDEQIKVKEEQLNGKDKQIKVKDEQIRDKDEQIKDLREQINIKDKQINLKDEHIKDLREQINNKDKPINLKDEQIKDNEEQINGKSTEQINYLIDDVKIISCLNSGPDGIFQMTFKGMEPFQSRCDLSRWTVIQRRINGSVNFNRKWKAYKDGFGDIRGEFFLGLEKIHLMTLTQPHELYIRLRDVNGTTKYARYDDFKVGSENEAYKLKSVGKFSGTTGDSLTYHLDGKFSTLDRDNDHASKFNCAESHGGGWWFKNCAHSSLNGIYYDGGKRTASRRFGLEWGYWRNYTSDYNNSLLFSEMMIRPKP